MKRFIKTERRTTPAVSRIVDEPTELDDQTPKNCHIYNVISSLVPAKDPEIKDERKCHKKCKCDSLIYKIISSLIPAKDLEIESECGSDAETKCDNVYEQICNVKKCNCYSFIYKMISNLLTAKDSDEKKCKSDAEKKCDTDVKECNCYSLIYKMISSLLTAKDKCFSDAEKKCHKKCKCDSFIYKVISSLIPAKNLEIENECDSAVEKKCDSDTEKRCDSNAKQKCDSNVKECSCYSLIYKIISNLVFGKEDECVSDAEKDCNKECKGDSFIYRVISSLVPVKNLEIENECISSDAEKKCDNDQINTDKCDSDQINSDKCDSDQINSDKCDTINTFDFGLDSNFSQFVLNIENFNDNYSHFVNEKNYNSDINHSSGLYQNTYDCQIIDSKNIASNHTNINNNIKSFHNNMLLRKRKFTISPKLITKNKKLKHSYDKFHNSNCNNSLKIIHVTEPTKTVDLIADNENLQCHIDYYLYHNILTLETYEQDYYNDYFDHSLYKIKSGVQSEIKNLKKNDEIMFSCLQNRSTYSVKGVKDLNFYKILMKLKCQSLERIYFTFTSGEFNFIMKDCTLFSLKNLLNKLFNLNYPNKIFNFMFISNIKPSDIYRIVEVTFSNINFIDMFKQFAVSLTEGLLYLHKKNIKHLHINSDEIQITIDGNLKIRMDNINKEPCEIVKRFMYHEKENDSNMFDFFTDYLLLGNVLLEILIPGFNMLKVEDFPFDLFMEMNIISNEFKKSNISEKWYNIFYFDLDMQQIKKLIFEKINDEYLKEFVESCFKPLQSRCENYVEDIIIRNYQVSHWSKILSKDLLMKNTFFHDIFSNSMNKKLGQVEVLNIYADFKDYQ